MLRISRGVGRSDLAPLPPLSEAVSSRMMSLQRSMHSSQMKTDGPAMSFLTSCWLLPQKEQYRSFSPLEDFLSDMGQVSSIELQMENRSVYYETVEFPRYNAIAGTQR